MNRLSNLAYVTALSSVLIFATGCSDRGSESYSIEKLDGFDLLSQVDPKGINQSFIWLDTLKSTEQDSIQSARVSAIKGHYIAMLKCNTHNACAQYHRETMAAWAQSYLNARS